MKPFTVIKPNLRHLLVAPPAHLSDGLEINDAVLAQRDFSGSVVSALNIETSRLEGLHFESSKFKRFSLRDVVAKDCVLFGTDFDEAGWLCVAFEKCVMTGSALTAAELEDVTFTDCKLNLLNLRFSKLKRVKFVNCVMTEADFYECTLKNVSFEGCDLTAATFDGAKLTNVDLRGSNLANLRGVSSLKGATIDTTQLVGLAPLMAAEIGLEVE
jgi:uncharacterized protein YjbI with pentapeptide repeats